MSAVQEPIQPIAHLRPLRIEDAEARGGPVGAVVGDDVVSEGSLERRAEAEDRGLAPLVAVVGAELDTDRAEVLEGVGEEEALAGGVHERALVFRSDPRPADLESPVGAPDVEVAGGPDDLAPDARDEGEMRALDACVEGGFDDSTAWQLVRVLRSRPATRETPVT